MKQKNHKFYTVDDKDKGKAPATIYDKDGQVKLYICKICHGVEASLATNCPGRPLSYLEMDKIERGELDF